MESDYFNGITASTLIVHYKSANDDLGEHVLRMEIITTGVLKKIFGLLRCFGVILAATMDKLMEMFFGQ